MRTSYFFFWVIAAGLATGSVSCKKNDYLSGGTINNPKVNMTTYDYLKNNSLNQFDTVLQIIDKAGIKDLINQQGVTFFAPTNTSVLIYLNARSTELQQVNPDAKYTLDTLFKYDLQRMADSMKMYVVNQPLTYDKLTANGVKYPTQLPGDTVVVAFIPTNNPVLGYFDQISTVPQILLYIQLWYPIDDPFNAFDIPTSLAAAAICQTTGVQTTTGILNVLANGFPLFFYGTKK
ncbi:fasciclin domain-containing protein [Flavitalea flava]